MLRDFKLHFAEKHIDFAKQISIVNVIYLIRLEIFFSEAELGFMMNLTIDEDHSSPEAVLEMSDFKFKREQLSELEFTKIVNEVKAGLRSDCDHRQDPSHGIHIHHRDLRRADREDCHAFTHYAS
jgi:hypothetical protein